MMSNNDVSRYLWSKVTVKQYQGEIFKVVGVQANHYNGRVTAVRVKNEAGTKCFYTEIKNISLIENNNE